MSSILQLQNQTIDHETLLQQLLRNNPDVTTTEKEVTPTEKEATSSQESTKMVNSRPADQLPVEDPLGAWQEGKPK